MRFLGSQQNLPQACVAQRGVAEETSYVLNALHGSVDQKAGPVFHPEEMPDKCRGDADLLSPSHLNVAYGL